ncbi:MAG: hypothetical protein KDB44_12170 [Mycobacterium sp.]|nr:hypothetical protein [Mycobacterium sp.]
MTVTVTLPGGGTDEYMRTHDSFVKQRDGSLDVVRSGAPELISYPSGDWAEVDGDEKKKHGFWG